MPDETIECRDCKNPFEFTQGERDFMLRLVREGKIKQFTPPARCLECRQSRKNLKQHQEQYG